MVNLKHFLTDLQQGAYLDSSKCISHELAEETGFKRFIAALYLYYMSIILLSAGVLAILTGPLHLDFLKASLFTLIIPYFFYRLFLSPLILKRFDFILPDAEKSKCTKLYRYVFVGSFCSFVGALVIVFCFSTKSI